MTLTFAGQISTNAANGTVLTDNASITTEGDTLPANNTDADIETVSVARGQPPPGPGPTTPPGPVTGPAAGPVATSPGSAAPTDGSPGASSSLAFTGIALAALALASLTLLGTGTLARVTGRVRRIRRPM